MRVLFISQYFHPEPFSNTDLAKALLRRGHIVDVICCVPNYPEGVFYPGYSNNICRKENLDGVTINRAWTFPRGRKSTSLLLNFLTFPVTATYSFLKLRNIRHDVSFTSMPSPIFQALVAVAAAVTRGVPSVYWVQDIWPDSLINTLGIRSRVIRKILLMFCGWLYRRADIVMVQSEAFRPKLEAMGVPRERIMFLPNSSPESFQSTTADAPDITVNLPPADLRLMFAGNIGESQNIDVFIQAARLFPDDLNVQWVIVGDGRDLGRIKEAVDANGLNDRFVFTGRQPMASMPHYYAHADAMLLSLKDTEIFRLTVPFKLQSYLAVGKPVIGSIGGEARRIIEEAKAGFCAEPDDAAALADAVIAFARLSATDRDRMAVSASAYYEKWYASDKVHDMLENALTLAAGKANRGSRT